MFGGKLAHKAKEVWFGHPPEWSVAAITAALVGVGFLGTIAIVIYLW